MDVTVFFLKLPQIKNVSMFVGLGAGGTTGNIGRTFYETFDDVVEQFVNSFQSVEYE